MVATPEPTPLPDAGAASPAIPVASPTAAGSGSAWATDNRLDHAMDTARSMAKDHPLLVAAVLVWLSIELIGDGLQALATVLASLNSTPEVSPSSLESRQVTPS